MADSEKDGASVWLSSSDKKYVLTWGDKVNLETKMRTYCPNANFEETFQKVLEKNHKYVHEVLLDINQEYISCLEKLSDDFQEAIESFPGESIDEFSDTTDPAILHHHAKVFRMSRFKLVWTHYEALVIIYKNTSNNDESVLQNLQDEKMVMLYEAVNYIKTKIDKIDKQTEKEQITPDYVTALIEAGLLDKDWKATKGLPKIVKYINEEWKMDNLEPGIFLQFKQRTGKPYTLKTVQEEIKRVKNSQ